MRTHKKMTAAFSLLFFILSNNTALANEHNNKKTNVDIVSYGIYAHTPDNGKSWINPISEKSIKGKSSSPVHLSSTRTIPAQFPLFFGFEYKIQNINENITELTTEVTHPKIKQHDGSYSTQYQQTQKFLVVNGVITATNGYLLENKDEAQLGKWIFTLKIKGKTITTQSFNVK